MDAQEAESRLRLIFRTLETTSAGDRESKLRQEVKGIFNQTPKSEHAMLLERLSRVFPVWPADVPPPPPLTEEEMVERLRMRSDSGDAMRRRIEGLLRQAGLGGGLATEDVAKIREKLGIDPGAVPAVGRVVEAFILMLQTMGDVDQAIRNFLHHHNLGVLAMQIPRFRETALKLLVLQDENSARHGELNRMESSCSLLTRVANLLVQWPESLAATLANKLAPQPIEVLAGKGVMGGLKHDRAWEEYQRRLNGARDPEAVKGEILEMFKRIISEMPKS